MEDKKMALDLDRELDDLDEGIEALINYIKDMMDRAIITKDIIKKTVKPRISGQGDLIHPHREFLGLYVLYQVLAEVDGKPILKTLTNENLEKCGLTEADVFEMALNNIHQDYHCMQQGRHIIMTGENFVNGPTLMLDTKALSELCTALKDDKLILNPLSINNILISSKEAYEKDTKEGKLEILEFYKEKFGDKETLNGKLYIFDDINKSINIYR